MIFSHFGKKFTTKSGILELMDDLGTAMSGDEQYYMLGGGNPAHIPEVNTIWRRRMTEILGNKQEFEEMVANYDKPQGKTVFLEALAELLNRQFGWPLTAKNIGITNGSQTSSFILLNMFSGSTAHPSTGVAPQGPQGSGRKKILFPLMPEYIGYADQTVEDDCYLSYPSTIEEIDEVTYKYHVNFDSLEVTDEVGAICVSRPTNPTGNVLTDREVRRLVELAETHDIPLILDNAYGTPFPDIIFEEVTPFWNEHVILSMSLSKIGLPSTRTGIIIADETIIKALSSVNAILSLANVSVGQVLTLPLIRSGEILSISRDIIKPFYLKKSLKTQVLIKETFGNKFDYRIHKSEGSIFLWIWFKELPITSKQLYERFKKRRVLIVPGNYFFFGLQQAWTHVNQCIRISYAQNEEDVKKGIEIMADEVARL